jgi:hypothetical protein
MITKGCGRYIGAVGGLVRARAEGVVVGGRGGDDAGIVGGGLPGGEGFEFACGGVFVVAVGELGVDAVALGAGGGVLPAAEVL